MTKNQKWLKHLAGGEPTRASVRRSLERPGYRAQFAQEHEVKRLKLLRKRQAAIRAAEEAARKEKAK